MTSKLYYDDGYLKEIEAAVVALAEDGIILDRTIFYPEGGGQPGDRGSFGDYEIIDTRKNEEGEPVHIIKGNLPAIGEKARLTLDWNHRYFYMTEHSAQHLVSALLFSDHGIGTVAVHQGERFFTIETNKGEIDEEELFQVEGEANRAIRENHAIEQREMSHDEAEALGMRRSIKVEGRVKVVFIDGLDAVACGGVHLRSTGEIGEIQYFGSERIRGHVRTMWKCGDLSVEYRRQNRKIVSELSSFLSAEPETIMHGVVRLSNEIAELKRNLRTAHEQIAKLELLQHKDEDVAVFRTDSDVSSYDGAFESDDPRVAFIIDGNGRFMFHGTKEGFEILKAGLSGYSLSGGGRGMLYRGSVKGNLESVLDDARGILDGGSTAHGI